MGHYIEELCKARGETPEDCAKRAGLDPAVLSRAVRGIVKPRPKTIEAICRALDITDEETKDEVYLSFWQVRKEQHDRASAALGKKAQALRKGQGEQK